MSSTPLAFVGQKDTYTRTVMIENDDVVRCRKCGSYAFRSSWDAVPGCANLECGSEDYWIQTDPEFHESREGAGLLHNSQNTVIEESEIRIEVLSSPEEIEDRYTRIRQLGWDRDKLKNACALVAGAGALGNEVLKNLALLGWGHIVVVDMDSIEDSNLARSVLFRQSDVGPRSFKANAAARGVNEINPDVKIVPIVGTLQESIGLGIFRRMDVVFGCLDNLQARLDLSRACWSTLTPYIDAGLDGINGDVYTFVPPYTACYGCTVSQAARRAARERHPCLRVKVGGARPVMPTAPTISAVMAGWQTQIAVKHLHGKPVPASQRIMVFGNSDECERYRVEPEPQCPEHNTDIIPEDDIVELPLQAGKTSLRQLVQIAQIELDMGTETMVVFDFDVLLTGACVNCGTHKDFYRRVTSVDLKEIVCPNCGKLLRLEPSQFEFDGSEEFANRSLNDLGVPPAHIILARNWPRRLYKFIELSGDLEGDWSNFFTQGKSRNPKLIPILVSVGMDQPKRQFLPARIPLLSLLEWSRQDWGLEKTVPAEQFVVANPSQGFNYELFESLTSRNTQPNDHIRIEVGLPAQRHIEKDKLEITLEEISNG